MAVPVTVYVTVVGVVDGLVMLNVNSPFVAGSEAFGVVAVTVTVAVSLSVIVTVAGAVFTVNNALFVPVKVMTTVSDGSNIVSSVTVTGIVTLVAPAGMVTVTGINIVSMPFVAVPVTVKVIVVLVADGLLNVTVNNPLPAGSDAFGCVAVTLTVAASLSVIVTVAGVALTVADALLVFTNVMITFSTPSTVKSSVTVTGKVTLVAFAGMMIVVAMLV